MAVFPSEFVLMVNVCSDILFLQAGRSAHASLRPDFP
jgi:hypothetical protein